MNVRDPDPDELREAIDERRRARRGARCLCGNPDWPGRCPGPSACPVHGVDLEAEGA
jgi:hypothetical protein